MQTIYEDDRPGPSRLSCSVRNELWPDARLLLAPPDLTHGWIPSSSYRSPCLWRSPRRSIPRSAMSAPRLISRDRQSVVEGKSVSVRVDLGGCRIIKKKKK